MEHGARHKATFVGPYRVLARLGSGAAGQVLRVEDSLGRQLAVKLLARSTEASKARFAREGEVTAQLNHPGIVRVHGMGEHEGAPYLVYELVEGEDLERCFERLSRERLLQITLEVAQALGYAHARGVVHRDVKPANVLVDTQGRARLADFGAALAVGLERLTRSGAVVGTPLYMAPEQATGDRERYGPATDVWALGVLLYRVLTGGEPFRARSLVQLVVLVASRPPTDPRKTDPSLPKGLVKVCLRALEKSPADRYADGAAFAADLQRALAGESVAGQGKRRSSWALVLAVLVVGVFMLSLGWLLAGNSAESSPRPAPVRPAPPVAKEDPELGRRRAELAKVLESLGQGDEQAAQARFVLLERGARRAGKLLELREQVVVALAGFADPEAGWPLLTWVAEFPEATEKQLGPAGQEFSRVGVQLVWQVVAAAEEFRVADAELATVLGLTGQARGMLEDMAACGLRLEERAIGERVMDTLALQWLTGAVDQETYWRSLLAAAKLDFPVTSDHLQPEGGIPDPERFRPWGSEPRDPWQLFLELRIVQRERPSRDVNEQLCRALVEPASFASEEWRLGPRQWAAAAAYLVIDPHGFSEESVQSMALIEKALAMDPENPSVYDAQAGWLSRKRFPQEARAANERGIACFDALYTEADPLRLKVIASLLLRQVNMHIEADERAGARLAYERLSRTDYNQADDLLSYHPWLAGD